jgi:hypothetical protein
MGHSSGWIPGGERKWAHGSVRPARLGILPLTDGPSWREPRLTSGPLGSQGPHGSGTQRRPARVGSVVGSSPRRK